MTPETDDLGEVRRVRFCCERPSRYAGWLLADGRVVPARCGAPNKCRYCAYMSTIENAVVVSLDAERYGHPTVGMTLTTVDPATTPEKFRLDVDKLFQMVRRRFGDVAYLGMVEFTTGRGRDGHRRIHQHLLLKGLSVWDAVAVEWYVRKLWSKRTGAYIVECRPLRSPAGATAYLIHHHRKMEQRPPEGWRGKRMRPSRGYFGEPVAELRREARLLASNKRLRRAASRMIEWDVLDGLPEEVVDEELSAALAEARREAAMVTFVKMSSEGGIISWRPAA